MAQIAAIRHGRDAAAMEQLSGCPRFAGPLCDTKCRAFSATPSYVAARSRAALSPLFDQVIEFEQHVPQVTVMPVERAGHVFAAHARAMVGQQLFNHRAGSFQTCFGAKQLGQADRFVEP